MVRFATGVGLVFKEIPGDGVQVQSVLKGGGAALSSHPPKSGDRLLAVDAQDARRQTLSALRHLIVGDEVCRVGKECMFDCQFEFVLEVSVGGHQAHPRQAQPVYAAHSHVSFSGDDGGIRIPRQ